ncbi:MAG: hypothetical protein AAB915_02095 [Patescibacteria group bacterium]
MKDTTTFTKKGRERSTPNPSISIREAIMLLEELKKALGRWPYSRDAVASALGHKRLTGPAARKVAALTHYNLLERRGDAYSVSRLGGDILNPLSDEEKTTAIKKAAISPRLFAKLINQFKGQGIPGRLDNILTREGISSNSAGEVAKIFTKTLEEAGLIVNGVIMADDAESIGESAEDISNLRPESALKTGAYPYNESGTGWSIAIKTGSPLTSEIKKKLIEVTELLENHNKPN